MKFIKKANFLTHFYSKIRFKKSTIFMAYFPLLISLGFPSMSFSMQAALLVSLGMPDAVLKAYFVQANHYGIPIVIRGFYSDRNEKFLNQKSDLNQSNSPLGDIRQTQTRFKQLIADKKQGGLQIDPKLFQAFQINAVPALVVYKTSLVCLKRNVLNKNPCEDSDFDVLMGNLPLKKLLDRIANESPSQARSVYARKLLNSKKSSNKPDTVDEKSIRSQGDLL